MKWLNNLKNIATENKPGKCPYCGSENTEYSATVVDHDTQMGYMDIWCNDCKKAYHMSRIKVESGYKTGIKLPKDLKY